MRSSLRLFAALVFGVGMMLVVARPARAQDAADQAWAVGDMEVAGRLYSARLRADSADQRALHRMALIRAWDGKYDEALALLDRLLRLAPGNTEARVDRARVLAWRGDPAAAAAALDPVIAADPRNVAALQARAQFLSWAGSYDASLQSYGRLMEITPGDRSLGLERARVLSWASRFPAAEAAYAAILREHPDDREALLGLATALSWAGRLDSAAVVYGRVLARTPGDVQAQEGVARVAAWRGDLIGAERRWRDLAAHHPNDADVQVGLSQTLRWQGRDAAALAAARRAVQIAPTDREARVELGWAELPMHPRGAPSFTYESDSDGNRISTFALGGGFRPAPWLDVRGDAYTRRAGLDATGAADRSTWGGMVTAAAQVEPGWTLSAGAGASANDVEGSEVRPAWRGAVSSPGRYPLTATLAYAHTVLDATALLIERRVETDELSLSAALTPAQGWSLSGAAGAADFHGRVSGETNRRTNANLALTRRVAGFFTVGAAARTFGFDRDLADGYFDPSRYRIAEALLRGAREWRKLGVDAELAPGVQQVESGDATATLRARGGISYLVAPGRRVGVSAGYANAGLQRLSPGDAGKGYRNTAVSIGGSWAF